jgi:hypothetical protein
MRLWIRRSALMAATVLALAACASDGKTQGVAEPVATTIAETTSTSPDTSPTTESVAGGDETSTTTVTADPLPQVDGPAAPDFVLALADGSAFSLSDEQKPVYLVFWAEW